MTSTAVFGLWAGAGVTASIVGLLWLHRATGPQRRVRSRPAEASSLGGQLGDRPAPDLRLESASDALDR
jgi:hypothetical protein